MISECLSKKTFLPKRTILTKKTTVNNDLIIYILFFSSYTKKDNTHKTTTNSKIIFLTPNNGIRINPAKKVPTILPTVEKEDILPETFPTSSKSLSFNLTQ